MLIPLAGLSGVVAYIETVLVQSPCFFNDRIV
jgi:hypothetical protein